MLRTFKREGTRAEMPLKMRVAKCVREQAKGKTVSSHVFRVKDNEL